ncbi:MAG TPA: ACP S-malonyltransferase [Dehalococcoidia bacterium]|nr:ACP S-malonyltransferase [Dehalococcoidia bacterium]
MEPSIGKVAWLFPGQGSQQVGMGQALSEKSAAAREVLDKADAILRRSLSEICFRGPEDLLRQTINTQPAILTVSLACLAAARERGMLAEMPDFVAGHSLGEYTAAVASGALSFEDGLLLVQERGRLMQAASEENPGTMIAILGLDEAAARELCTASGAQVCNVNAPGQVVVGGDLDAVARAAEMARSHGARRTVPLNVSGAFHTSLMKPAAVGMAAALAGTAFREPQASIVANGTGMPLHDAASFRQELSFQLTHPVLWQQSVEHMLASGVSTFVEFGPGQVLSGLVKRVAPAATVRNVGEDEILSESA